MRLCPVHNVQMAVVHRMCRGVLRARNQCNECVAAWHRARRVRRLTDAFRKLATMPRPVA